MGSGRTPPQRQARILVVEDDLDDREAIAELLETSGYEVDRAIDGADALKLARVRPPDAVVVDISMPRMDGNEVARRLRKEVGLAKVPILAVTGRPGAASSGLFTQVQLKPVKGDVLLQTLRMLLPAGAAKTA